MYMFCYQCQEASEGKACVAKGNCGKTEDIAKAQDLLMFIAKGVSVFTVKARDLGIENIQADNFVIESLCTTITNANFDKDLIYDKVRQGLKLKWQVKKQLTEAGVKFNGDIGWFKNMLSFWGLAKKEKQFYLPDAAVWHATDIKVFEGKGSQVGVLSTKDEDIRSLREFLIYGLKGLAANVKRAENLVDKQDKFHAFIQKALVITLDNAQEIDDLLALVLECGKYGAEIMELLEKINVSNYGVPEITKVNTEVGIKPGILVAGNNFKDLDELLKQTEDKDIDIYTHGDMLMANCYPKFKKYKNLIGNYGNSWWKQNEEFESFKGPVIVTSSCLMPPLPSYKDRLFTTGAVAYPGTVVIPHSNDGSPKDFTAIIEKAKTCQSPIQIGKGEIESGYGHDQSDIIKNKIKEAVKCEKLKRIVVIAGEDGRSANREYYTKAAEELPDDAVILTAGCVKYRFNKLISGYIGDLPKVVDFGQCNDIYLLASMIMKLKEELEAEGVKEIPITFNYSWYSQESIIVLLSLLHLNFKNINIGPSFPAFMSKKIMKSFADEFELRNIPSCN